MIDDLDNQTQALPLEPKRGRGRPATGAAMTPAEKQKAYRERQAKRKTEPSMDMEKVKATAAHYIEKLERELESAKERAQQAEANFVTLRKKLDKALATITELKRNKSNVTDNSRIGESAKSIINSVFEVANATEGSSWRIQRKGKGKWLTQIGEYRNEAHAIDTLMNMPSGEKNDQYRVVEIKLEIEN